MIKKKVAIIISVIASVVIVTLAIVLPLVLSGGDEHRHKYIDSVVAPTCSEQGYTLHKCSCGKSYKDSYVSATGEHTFESYTYNNDATCITDGTETATCENCDEKDTRTKVGTAHHTYVDGKCTFCGALDTTATEGLSYYEIKQSGQVIGYRVSVGKAGANNYIYIPDTYNDKPVTVIDTDGFSNCTAIRSVRLPSGLEKIYSNAFSGCTGLQNIEFPNGLKEIGMSAFSGCSNLQAAVLPDSITSIGNSAFSGCNKIQFANDGIGKYLGTSTNPYFVLLEIVNEDATQYELNDKTVVIADWAFAYGYGLQSCDYNGAGGVAIPVSVKFIGSSISTGISMARIAYKGTKEQWKNIEKDSEWYDGGTLNGKKLQISQIVCSDGRVSAS